MLFRSSAVDAYPRPHLASVRVTLLTEKTVVRVLVENGRAVGVQLSSKGFEAIMARQVVLSAGSIQSPTILMRSGIGPAGQLRRHGIGVIVDSPEVGENLQDQDRKSVVSGKRVSVRVVLGGRRLNKQKKRH